MHTERGIAPMVQQVQDQIAVPTGAPPPPSQDQQDQVSPVQKGPYQHGGMIQGNASGVELARMRGELEEFEDRLEDKLAVLTAAIERLSEERNGQIEQQGPHGLSHSLHPPTIVDDAGQLLVRHSSYMTARRIAPTLGVNDELRRLPATLPEPTPLIRTASAPRVLRLPVPGSDSPLNRRRVDESF
jgi:hypothetical protein